MDAAATIPRSRRRSAERTTIPTPPGTPSPSLPLRFLMQQPPDTFRHAWRNLLLVVAGGFVAIALAVFFGLLVSR